MSEIYDPRQTVGTNQHCVWFELGGKAQQAARRLRWIATADITISSQERDLIFNTLGSNGGVKRKEVMVGQAIVYPKVFLSTSGPEERFYMMCPIGTDNNGKISFFTPVDSSRVKERDLSGLQEEFFSGRTRSMPVVQWPYRQIPDRPASEPFAQP